MVKNGAMPAAERRAHDRSSSPSGGGDGASRMPKIPPALALSNGADCSKHAYTRPRIPYFCRPQKLGRGVAAEVVSKTGQVAMSAKLSPVVALFAGMSEFSFLDVCAITDSAAMPKVFGN